MKNGYLTYYELLEISVNATTAEIESAYKKAAIKYHPDKQGGNESANRLFQYINDAREVLTDPEKRQHYDALLNGYSKYEDQKNVHDFVVPTSPSQTNTGNLVAIGILGLIVGAIIADNK